ncbi:unnamed protein product [Calypogeia fissa]
MVLEETYVKLSRRPRSPPHRVSVCKMHGNRMTDIVVVGGCIHPYEEVCDDCEYEGGLTEPAGCDENSRKKRSHLVKWLRHHHPYFLGTRDTPDGLDFHIYP